MTGCLNGGSCVFNEEKETFACACKGPWSGEKCELGKTVVLLLNFVMNKRKSDSRRFYDSLKSLKLTKFTSFAWKTTQP